MTLQYEIEEFLGISASSMPRLSNDEASKLSGKLSVEELTRYLKKSKNNVSPGSTGFTADFYKFFWIDIKQLVTRSINYSFDIGALSVQQRLGIITLLPKGSKDKRYLGNWRPVTLLDTLYKLISGCLADRIKPALDKLIHPDQKGFLSGRYIGEAVRTCYDTLDYAKTNNKAGLLLLVDFQKAFDSVSFRYLEKCLNFLNFPPDIIKWIQLLLYNFQAVINHCGNISQRFDICRGCRQGDPIAPYLFLIAVEFLAHKLRNNTQIKGFSFCQNLSHTLDLYADDLTIYLTPEEQNLKCVLEILKSFYRLSCLKININKTKAVWFGSEAGSRRTLCSDEELDWADNFMLLGIQFDSKLENMGRNYSKKMEEIRHMLNSWQFRYLTPYGKVVIIKSLALSKLSHIALVVPTLSKRDMKNFENLCFDFLWSGKNAKVARSDALNSLGQGGLSMVDIGLFWQALKCSWIRRLAKTDAFWPKILEKNLEKIGAKVNDIFCEGPNILKQMSVKISNQFWQNTLNAAGNVLTEACNNAADNFDLLPLFANPIFRHNGKLLDRKKLNILSDKISSVSDFYKGRDQLYSLAEIRSIYDLNMSPKQYEIIKNAMKSAAEKLDLKKLNWQQQPRQPFTLKIALRQQRGCRVFYHLLRSKHNKHTSLRKYELKWNLRLNLNLPVVFWDSVWNLHAKIKSNNQFKWLQCQILRHSLYTNNRVSKFKPEVSEMCSLCFTHVENPLTLFWECQTTRNFWSQVRTFLADHTFQLPDSRLSILFGFSREPWDSVSNTIVMIGKQVIWQSKVKKQRPNLLQFKGLLKKYLLLLRYCCTIENSDSSLLNFKQQWDCILRGLDQDG